MTKQTYEIIAWCDRTYYARLSVEAESPDQALTLGRERVHDADVYDRQRHREEKSLIHQPTGSYPPLANGWQRRSLRRARTDPRRRP